MKETFFNNLSNLERSKDYIHPAVEQAYKKAHATLHESEIDPRDFEELYGKENVDRDLTSVKNKEKGFTKDANSVYAEVLEAVMYHQIGHGNWFGEKAQTIKPSQYDDVYNGCDLILELEDLQQKLSHLSLSIDVTFGTTTEEKKFSAIKKNIDNGNLGKIKYFYSEHGGFRGELSKVPQVVIGVEKDIVVQLAGLWSTEGMLKEKTEEMLREHPVQRVILSEILLQLQVFKNYAEETGKTTLIPTYQKNIAILEEILKEKGFMSMGNLRNDKVFTAIRESLSIFKNEK